MKVVLHLAISADGFIAKPNGNSDWVSPADDVVFKKRVKETECLVVGRQTFEQYQGSVYPVKNATNIVLSKKTNQKVSGVTFAESPNIALKIAQEKGCSGILIAGGGHTSAAFLEADLIDEIFFSVHPLILGEGISPFAGIEFDKKVRLLGTKSFGDYLLELHYEVLKL